MQTRNSLYWTSKCSHLRNISKISAFSSNKNVSLSEVKDLLPSFVLKRKLIWLECWSYELKVMSSGLAGTNQQTTVYSTHLFVSFLLIKKRILQDVTRRICKWDSVFSLSWTILFPFCLILFILKNSPHIYETCLLPSLTLTSLFTVKRLGRNSPSSTLNLHGLKLNQS